MSIWEKRSTRLIITISCICIVVASVLLPIKVGDMYLSMVLFMIVLCTPLYAVIYLIAKEIESKIAHKYRSQGFKEGYESAVAQLEEKRIKD